MIEFDLKKSVLRANVPLKDYSTMGVGGCAQYFFEVADLGELEYILSRCRDYGISRVILGGGSNTLFSDYGYEGAVIRFGPAFSGVYREGDRVLVQSGKTLPALCRELRETGLSGLEFACGIPASAGGAAVMNAGCFGGEMAERIERVDCFFKRHFSLENRECRFGYRDSVFRQNPELVVTAVKFRLTPADPAEIAARMAEVTQLRRASQGETRRSLGSVFLRGEIPAAKLIDGAGLKGFRIGGAAVSERHAGYIVNLGDATAENILALIAHITSTVYEKYGIMLHEEISRVGNMSCRF